MIYLPRRRLPLHLFWGCWYLPGVRRLFPLHCPQRRNPHERAQLSRVALHLPLGWFCSKTETITTCSLKRIFQHTHKLFSAIIRSSISTHACCFNVSQSRKEIVLLFYLRLIMHIAYLVVLRNKKIYTSLRDLTALIPTKFPVSFLTSLDVKLFHNKLSGLWQLEN